MSQDNPLDFSIRALRVLVAVDEAGTMAKAAERLGASPAAVSQQIANLEALARSCPRGADGGLRSPGADDGAEALLPAAPGKSRPLEWTGWVDNP